MRAYTLPGGLCGVRFRPQGGCETRPRKAACQAAWLSRASKTARGPGPRLDLSNDTQPHGPARHKQHPAPAWARVPTSARASETLSLNPRDQGPSLIHISTKEPLSSGNCTGRCLVFKSFCLAKVTAHPRKNTSHLLAEHCSQASGPLPFSGDTPHMHCPTPRTCCGPECLPPLSPFSGKALAALPHWALLGTLSSLSGPQHGCPWRLPLIHNIYDSWVPSPGPELGRQWGMRVIRFLSSCYSLIGWFLGQGVQLEEPQTLRLEGFGG